MAQGERLTTQVRMHSGAPALIVNGRPHDGLAFWHSRPLEAGDDFARFARADIDLVTFGLGWGQCVPNADSECDFAAFDERVHLALTSNPGALILPRVSLDPPRWWREQYPDEIASLLPVAGGPARRLRPSFTSTRWIADASAMLERVIEHCEAHHPTRIYGYHIAAGDCGEWAHSWDPELGDYGPANVAAFRRWLRKRYAGNVQALSRAWAADIQSFDAVEIPRDRLLEIAVPERSESLFDPARERSAIDYLVFHSESVADAIIELSAVAKKKLAALGADKICGVFYGYHFFVPSLPYGVHNAGHQALARVLASPDVDFVAAPINYQERHAGGMYQAQLVAGSVRLAQKLYYAEDDTYTPLSKPRNLRYQPPDLPTMEHVHWRNLLSALRDGGTQWWMDLFGEGWFRDDTLMASIGRMRQHGRMRLDADRTPSAQVAVIISMPSMARIRCHTGLIDATIARQISELAALGTSFDCYLSEDLGRLLDQPYASNYRFFVALNAVYLSEREREIVQRRLRRDGRTLLWAYGGGALTDDAFSLGAMHQACGIRAAIARHEPGVVAALRVVTNVTGERVVYGTDQHVAPHLCGDDPDAEVVGWLVARGQPGLLVKREAACTSIWSAAPAVPSSLLRSFARRAGVHIYSDGGGLVIAERGQLALHAAHAGRHRIALPERSDVTDLRSGAVVAQGVTGFDVELTRGQTALWRIEPRG